MLTKRNHELAATAFFGHAQVLDTFNRSRRQMQELAQDINIAFLPTNQAYGSRRQNGSSDPVRLIGRSCEILHGLADAPHASVALACSAEELLDHRTQAGGLEQRPTLVKNRHAAGAAA